VTDLVFIEERPVQGREHTPEAGATIGRADCDILLIDPEVSRRHAAIRSVNGGVAVEDLDSKNGTWVNEERITGIKELKPGDRIRFGNTVWHLKRRPEADAEPEAQKAGFGDTVFAAVPPAADEPEAKTPS